MLERCLCLLCMDKRSCFEDLLEQDKSFSILCRNLEMLVTKMSKISPSFFSEIFLWSVINCNLRVSSTNVRSVFLGRESNSYLGPQIWDVAPLKLEESTSFDVIKKCIKVWKPKNCPCRLYKQYVSNLRFIAVILWTF